ELIRCRSGGSIHNLHGPAKTKIVERLCELRWSLRDPFHLLLVRIKRPKTSGGAISAKPEAAYEQPQLDGVLRGSPIGCRAADQTLECQSEGLASRQSWPAALVLVGENGGHGLCLTGRYRSIPNQRHMA